MVGWRKLKKNKHWKKLRFSYSWRVNQCPFIWYQGTKMTKTKISLKTFSLNVPIYSPSIWGCLANSKKNFFLINFALRFESFGLLLEFLLLFLQEVITACYLDTSMQFHKRRWLLSVIIRIADSAIFKITSFVVFEIWIYTVCMLGILYAVYSSVYRCILWHFLNLVYRV